MGRDRAYARDMSIAIERNVLELLSRANELLELMAADGVAPGVDQVTGNAVASGWRPPSVNARTANAATSSPHLTGEGLDVQDTWPERPVARWCLQHLDQLERVGLWMEDPRWTARVRPDGGADPWVHWQSRPPRSGRRVFIPSTAAPTSPALPEQAQ